MHNKLREWILKTDTAGKPLSKKQSSHDNKYYRFAIANHTTTEPLLPIGENFDLRTLMCYAIYCSEHGVKGGWKSVKNYVGSAVKMAARLGIHDPRAESAMSEIWWNQFLTAFNQKVKAQHAVKLKIQPAHHQAMAIDMDPDNKPQDLRDSAMYAFLMYFACRVGHVAPKSSKDPKHVLRFEDLYFMPNFDNPTTVFARMASTKTRGVNMDTPTWQAVAALKPAKDSGIDYEKMCPVRTLKKYVQATYKGNPAAPIFQRVGAPGKPIGRTEFTDTLKARLMIAARHLSGPVDVRLYSGISWRKGGLSALAGGVRLNHLADHADHKDVKSSRSYTAQTIEERAQHAHVIAEKYSRNGAKKRRFAAFR